MLASNNWIQKNLCINKFIEFNSQTNCNDIHSNDQTKKLESRIEVFNSIKVSAPLIEIDRAENATGN